MCDGALNILPAALSAVATVVVANIACKQYRTAIIANRMAVFQRRIKVYQAVEEYLRGFSADFNLGKRRDEQSRALIDARDEAKFLFGNEVNEFLVRLFKEALGKQELVESNRGLDNRLPVSVHETLFDWETSCQNESERLFRPYLEYREK